MKKILIVEDDFDIGEIVSMALSTNYHVLVKQDSTNLVEVLKQFKPDVILLDNHIGNKNAKEILSEIALEFPRPSLNLSLILFSAHHDIAKIAEEIGAADFIAKPFDLDELNKCIANVLNQQYLKS